MTRTSRIAAVLGTLALAAPLALAHVNPPMLLLSDADALAAALPAATTFSQLELKLSPQQKQALQKEWRFKADDSSYRAYQGRDAQGRPAGAVMLLTQATIHGPVRVAVGVGRDGRVAGAAVVEVSEESYAWVKPLIDRGLTKTYLGRDARGDFKVPEELVTGRQRSMRQFYAKVVASMVQWGAAIYETAGLGRTD